MVITILFQEIEEEKKNKEVTRKGRFTSVKLRSVRNLLFQTKTNLNIREPLFDLSMRSGGISPESLFPDKLLLR